MVNKHDYFSSVADAYAQFRPDYPQELYEFINAQCPSHDRAWDVGTGNGQVAIQLAQSFASVVASDLSEQQLQAAVLHERIQYQVGPAETLELTNQKFDLITVGQAVHWFDLSKFYLKVNQVLVQNGILAVWTYNLPQIDTELDQLILELYGKRTKPYWAPERHYIDEQYATLPFPYQRESAPVFKITKEWDVSALLGYLATWSGYRKCKEVTGIDHLAEMQDRFIQAFGQQKRTVCWPLTLVWGRKQA